MLSFAIIRSKITTPRLIITITRSNITIPRSIVRIPSLIVGISRSRTYKVVKIGNTTGDQVLY